MVFVSNLYYLIKLLQLFPAFFIYTPFGTLSIFVALSKFCHLIELLSFSHPLLSIHFFYVIYAPYKCTCCTHHITQLSLLSYREHALSANIPLELTRRLWPFCHSDMGGSRHGWGFSILTNSYVIVSLMFT